MKIFFDTEFTGLHQNTTLISIGLVSEDGRKFYAEFDDYDKSQVNDWITENVLAHRWYHSGRFDWDIPSYYLYDNTANIAVKLREYLEQFDSVELVSDVCHYDMVLFINIFGTAFDIPSNVCAACIDINQMIADYHKVDILTAFDVSREEMLKVNNIEIEGTKHNALCDAEVIKELYYLMNGEK